MNPCWGRVWNINACLCIETGLPPWLSCLAGPCWGRVWNINACLYIETGLPPWLSCLAGPCWGRVWNINGCHCIETGLPPWLSCLAGPCWGRVWNINACLYIETGLPPWLSCLAESLLRACVEHQCLPLYRDRPASMAELSSRIIEGDTWLVDSRCESLLKGGGGGGGRVWNINACLHGWAIYQNP